MADDPKGARAVVEAPEQRGRREGAFDESLVAVDVGGEKERELARVGDLSGEEVLEDLGEAVVPVAGEDRLRPSRRAARGGCDRSCPRARCTWP